MDIEDRLPALLRAAADGQPDAPALFDAVTSRVQRRQRRRRGLAAGGVAAVVAAAVAVPVAVSSQRTTDQRVVTVPVAPSPTAPTAATATSSTLPAPPEAASCPAGTLAGTGSGRQRDAPRDRLLPAGAATLTVCAWTPVGEGPGSGYRLAWRGVVPAARVHAEVAAVDALPLKGSFLLCLRTHPLLLSVVARYPGGRTLTVDLVEPCDAYFTNGVFFAPASPSVVRALEDAQPVPPGPNGFLTVRLSFSPSLHTTDAGFTYGDGVRVLHGRRRVAVLTRQPDDSYRGRVPAGTYTLTAATGALHPQLCRGRATVAAGGETSAVVGCPGGR